MSKSIDTRENLEKKIKRHELWLKTLSVLAILILLAGVGVFIYFQTSGESRKQLDDPTNIKIEEVGINYVLSFNAVEKASAYRISINGDILQIDSSLTSYNITDLVQKPQKYTISVQAVGDKGYKNSNVVFADDLEVYKTLQMPVVELDTYDSKIVWLEIDNADAYEVTVVVNGDTSAKKTFRVTKTEFDINDIVVDFTKTYSFTVEALSDNQYINKSPTSYAVEHILQGRLQSPQNVAYNDSSSTLSWDAVENAETYTIVLKHGSEQKTYKTELNSFVFPSSDISDIGAYTTYVYANNVHEMNESGEIVWFLASEYSEFVDFSIYKQLQAPTNLKYQLNENLVWFTWDAVENARTYVVELLNTAGEKYYEYTAQTNEINILRSSLNGKFSVHIKANGYSYFLESGFSEKIEVDATDKFASVRDISVLDGGKYLTFTCPSSNLDGSLSVFAQNGFLVKIYNSQLTEEELNDENLRPAPVFSGTIFTTELDTSSIFNELKVYTIIISVNEYSYFLASDDATATYVHNIQLGVPYNLSFSKTGVSLVLNFSTDIDTCDFTIDLGSDIIENVKEKYASFITSTYDEVAGVYNYTIDYSGLYFVLNEVNPLLMAQKYTAKIKSVPNTNGESGDSSQNDGSVPTYIASGYSNIAIYINKLKLETPQFIQIENNDEDEVLLYFTQVPNAISYIISMYSESTGTTQVMTSRFTTVNVYDIISAGTNIITITAVGAGYYINSDPSAEEEYYYIAILKAPTDVSVVEEEDDSTHIYARFTTTRFAEYYKVSIRQTHRVIVVGDTRTVEEIADAEFEMIDTQYPRGTVFTKCEITQYLLDRNSFGRYEVRVKGYLNQLGDIAESEWSEPAVYNYYDRQLMPTNLQVENKILTFDGVGSALNGYIVRVDFMLSDGTFSSHEISVSETTLDLTSEIASRGGVGQFKVYAMTRGVDELFLRNSAWSSPAEFSVSITLADPTNFVFNEYQDVSWSSDPNMEYEHLLIQFSNSSITNLKLVEILDDSFSVSVYSLRSLIRQYGDGFYRISVQSFSSNPLVNPSNRVTYVYTKFVQLDAPVLIEVVERGNRVEATFTTVDNAYSYAVLAKLPGQSEWTKVLTGIMDNGEERLTVDIKNALANFLGANRYNIAVIAETHEYFSESERSNDITFDLWLTFSPPSNLTVEYQDGRYFAKWDHVPNAMDYTLSVDTIVRDTKISANKFDITDIIGSNKTGNFLIAVRTNATGYYYKSAYAVYDFYLTQRLETPVLEYNDETYDLTIHGSNSGIGYEIVINYYKNETVDRFQGTILNLRAQMKTTGLGIYKITARELGDEVYYVNSDWSEELTAYYTQPLDSLVLFNIDKREIDGAFNYYVVATKPSAEIYQNALVQYDFYEVDSIDYELTGEETPVLTKYSNENEFLITGLSDTKYYVVTATILGVFDNRNIYVDGEYLSIIQLQQALRDLAYYTNSSPISINFSTLGNLLGAPTITDIKMLADKRLQITFNKSLNAKEYTMVVNRESAGGATIFSDSAIASTDDSNSIVVKIDVVVGEYTDEYDIYNITLYANEVRNESDEVVYGQSPSVEVKFENITTLERPTSHILLNSDGSLRLYVDNIEFAVGYNFELSINGYLQEIAVDSTGYMILDLPQYGAYILRAQALGDEYHKDSEFGEYTTFTHSLEIEGVREVNIVDNSDETGGQATRIYAEWEAVAGATAYGVRVDKDGIKIFEDATPRTYYDLINTFTNYGYGVYTVWAKTNGDGAFVKGEDTYSAFDNYIYKGQFATPLNLNIEMEELASSMKYTVSFDTVYGASEYVLSFYSKDGETLIAQLAINANDLEIRNGKAFGDISNFLKNIDGGEYLVSVKVSETSQYFASDESDKIAFTNYHKHDNPNLHAVSDGVNPVIKLYFDDVEHAKGYKLLINGESYLVDGSEVFAYPTAGYLEIYALFLNVGNSSLDNEFTLVVLGDREEYYLDSTFEEIAGALMFALKQVNNILIEQTNITAIPNGDSSRVNLTFEQVDFASHYELWINGVYVKNLAYGESVYDLYNEFKDRLPTLYTISLVAVDSVYGLNPSNAREYEFNYTLAFTAPTNISLSSSKVLTWGIPENFDSFSVLAGGNLSEQQYEIKVIYTSGLEEKTVVEGIYTATRAYDLSEYLMEAGGYRIEVYACDNICTSGVGTFSKSITPATSRFDVVVKLEAVTNIQIYEEKDKIRMSFTKTPKFDYIYAEQDVYFDIYLNGEIIFSLSYDASSVGIDLTNYLWGGDNIIFIVTRDRDADHYISSDPSERVSYIYNLKFVAIFNARVINDESQSKQFLRFDRFKVNGLSDEEINGLTYTISAVNTLTGENIGTRNNMLATVFNTSTMQIDVTEFVNGIPGTYTFTVKINEFSKTVTLGGSVINFKMLESSEISVEYRHQLRAEMLDLSLLVIDSDGKERVPDEGLEMSEMWLSFDVKFSPEYMNTANILLYALYINQIEYYLSIPFSFEHVGTQVVATGRMIGGAMPIDVSTFVKISTYETNGITTVTLSISLVPLLEASGFNIYKTGVINIKAKSQEQGYYLESNYQPNYLVYDYRLKYQTPTGLELVTREDGLHYIKWDEPTHEHIEDYYRLVEEYNVTITSEGIITESGSITNPHLTKGGKHSVDFTPDLIISENGYLYFCVEDYLFAGHNTISLKCNASETLHYYESDTITITKQPFIKKLVTPDFVVQDLSVNVTGGDNVNKGVEIIITNFDNVLDYDEELRKVVNYNVDAQYRLSITSVSRGYSSVINPTQKDFMNYSIDFRVNKNGLINVISGGEYVLYNRISFYVSENKGKLHIVWTLDQPGEYTYNLYAIGNETFYTSDSDINTIVHQTTYNAPDLSFSVAVYHDPTGIEASRDEKQTTKISKIELTWQTQLSHFYGATYTINIVGSFNRGQTTSDDALNNIIVTNATSITFSPTENAEVFNVISKRPAYYTFSIFTNQMDAETESDASETMTYYLAYTANSRHAVEKTYNYLLKINTPEDCSIVEYDVERIGNQVYIKTKIPQYFIDAQIETSITQIYLTYKILQCDPSFNVGNNAPAKSYTSAKASILLASNINASGVEDGYYYINITGQLFPGLNEITLSFNDIQEQNFVASDSEVFEHNHVVTLASVQSAYFENLYNADHYVVGMTMTFENVEFNKYFAYLLKVNGTEYNKAFSKTLLLKVEEANYVQGSSANYRYVKCYDITTGVAVEVSATGLYTRSQPNASYVYSNFTYAPAQLPTAGNANYAYNLTFLILVDGGLPDNYEFELTTLGECEKSGAVSQYLNYPTLASATISSSPYYFNNIMKGTLREADLEIGVADGTNFEIAQGNNTNQFIAYIRDIDTVNGAESYVYLNYTGSGAISGTQYLPNIALRMTLKDEQALYYSITVNNLSRNLKTTLEIASEYKDVGIANLILAYDKLNKRYVSTISDVTISRVSGQWVAYIDLMTLGGGVFTTNGKYEIFVSAHNENKIINEVNEYESVYDSTYVNSVSRFSARFDRVVTPQISFTPFIDPSDSTYGLFCVTNYNLISNIIKNVNLSSARFNVNLEYALEGQGYSRTPLIINFPLNTDSIAYEKNGLLYIRESYIKGQLDALGANLGTTKVRLYFDVFETGYIWDSEYSNESEFRYRAYINFMTFASTSQQYNTGSNYSDNVMSPGSQTIYTKNRFNNSYRELATNVSIKYALNSTVYVERYSGFQVEIAVWYGSNRNKAVKWVVQFGNHEEEILTFIRSGRYDTGIFVDALKNAGQTISYGEYQLNMQINRIIDMYGYTVDEDKAVFDNSIYKKDIIIKAKLYAPTSVTIRYDEDNLEVYGFEATFNTSSILSNFTSSYAYIDYEFILDGRTEYSDSDRINNIRTRFSVTNLSLTDSGTWKCQASTSISSRSSAYDYIEPSDACESDSVFIPYVAGIYSASLSSSGDLKNTISFSVDVRQARKKDADGSSQFKTRINLTSIEFHVELFNVTTGVTDLQTPTLTYEGTATDITRKMTDDFGKLSRNVTGTAQGLSPGLYVMKIRAKEFTYGGVTYSQTSNYYITKYNRGSGCNSYISSKVSDVTKKAQTASNCFKLTYLIGYDSWNASNITYTRSDMSQKGYVSGMTLKETLCDASGEPLKFVLYAVEFNVYSSKSTSATDKKQFKTIYSSADVAKDAYFSIITGASNPNLTTRTSYSAVTGSGAKESIEGVAMNLLGKIDKTKIASSTWPYITLFAPVAENSSNKKTDLSTNGEISFFYTGIKNSSSLEPKQKRLAVPTNLKIDRVHKDDGALDPGRNEFTVTWDDSNDGKVSEYEGKGYQDYTGTFEGNVWDQIEDSVQNGPAGGNPGWIVDAAGSLLWGTDKHIEKVNTHKTTKTKTYKFTQHFHVTQLWDDELWSNNGWLDMRLFNPEEFKMIIRAISNTAEYEDSFYACVMTKDYTKEKDGESSWGGNPGIPGEGLVFSNGSDGKPEYMKMPVHNEISF